jgi:hypothetical protein
MYYEVEHEKIWLFAHTMHLRVLYESQDKQSLLVSAVLTEGVFVTETETIHCEVRNESVNVIKVNRSL